MVETSLPAQRHFGETTRADAWWFQPLAVFLGFAAFIVYSTWSAFHPLYNGACAYWYHGNGADYLSPFFSPQLFYPATCPGPAIHAWFGAQPAWWPSWLLFSPAFLVLWAPAGFRFTCYYYRGAYYKAFWADPAACAVGEPRKGYLGEKSFPLILQNVHRYFTYIAIVFIFILGYDAWESLWFATPSGAHLGIGIGTIVLTINVLLLAGYTFGCHSLRHLFGGFLDEPSKRPLCAKSYACVSCLNRRHMLWAWLSLFWVGFTDIYVRLCAAGLWHDFRIIF
ncbi:MAG: succinate dehydrogenase [Verrucomicrobia bacterium]|nr:succinate dehydrogenase [Verrucomicrobiota bacterium]MDE3099426.1 succinate dehydrogenase [Verrucomicrobiota bacterium]